MFRLLVSALLAVAILGVHAPARAASLGFTATLSIQVGVFPQAVASGSGTGTSAGAGGAASIPAGVFSIVSTVPIIPPLLTAIDGFGLGAPGQFGGSLPLNPASNQTLAWNGVTGTMAVPLSGYLLTGFGGTTTPTMIAAGIPLGVVGVGGNQKFTVGGGLIMGTIMGNPYQLGMLTLMGAVQGIPSSLMGTGFDNRTQNGAGVLQLVTPTVVSLGALGTLSALGTLTVSYVPEPATFCLIGAGLAVLGAMRRRQVRR